jgi:hypothetical protein
VSMRRVIAPALAVFVVLVSGCSVFRHDARIVGYDGGAIGITDSQPHQPYLSNDLVICLDRPGTAMITKIDPLNSHNGLTVNAFAAVPRVAVNGDINIPSGSTIADVTSAPSFTVTQKCPPVTETPTDGAQYGYTLFVQFSKPSDGSAWDDGVRVFYTSGGHSYTTDLHSRVALCTAGEDVGELCASR